LRFGAPVLQLYRTSDPDWGERGTYHVLVRGAVVRIGWDDEFILVERHPLPLESARTDQPDSSQREWYLVVVSTGDARFSRSYDRFLGFMTEEGVPDTIEMRDARQVFQTQLFDRFQRSN
jgi:hypothetical protein